ncbi:hypothetical protein [uncultured Jatrophihabitans sp.]|uniref:hypothetical protein n=1 Tax=uncultured Jatrophihabitans sp. TaxID=1610747 RepID=UPI0035CBC36A
MRLLSVDARAVDERGVGFAQLIESAGADVACIHGAPHLLRWRSKCAAIARRSGLVVVGGGRLAGGNLLLSALGVDELDYQDLRLPGGTRLGPAGAALGVLRVAGRDVVVAATTLLGTVPQRVAQARHLQDALARLTADTPPAVVSVRGVDRPGTATWASVAAGRTPVGGRVFVDTRITVAAHADLDGHAGAQLPPVVLDLELGQQPTSRRSRPDHPIPQGPAEIIDESRG